MKKMLLVIMLAGMVALGFNPQVSLADWETVGSAGFSKDVINYISLAFSPLTNEPYVAYREGSDVDGKLNVMRFNRQSSWVNVGLPNFINASHISLAFRRAIPYASFRDNTNAGKATVMRFNGTSWVNVGYPGFSSKTVYSTSLAFNPKTNEPYVAFIDGSSLPGKATVMKFDGTSWVNVGIESFSSDAINYINLAFNPLTSEPYVVFGEATTSRQATVMKFDGVSWVNIGSRGFSAGAVAYTTIAFNPLTNEPYVAYQDIPAGLSAKVMKFDGTAWIKVGGGISAGTANFISLAFNPLTSEPYVAYYSGYDLGKMTVNKFNGSAWVYVGNQGFSDNAVYYTNSLVFNPKTNEPYVAFRDGLSPGKATVMKFASEAACIISNPFGYTVSLGDILLEIGCEDSKGVVLTNHFHRKFSLFRWEKFPSEALVEKFLTNTMINSDEKFILLCSEHCSE